MDIVREKDPFLSESFDDERRTWSQERPAFSKPKPKPAASPVVRPKTTAILPKAHVPTPGFTAAAPHELQTGMEVEHEKFGFGKIINMEGSLPDVKATVFFPELGNKQLLLKFAKLRIVN